MRENDDPKTGPARRTELPSSPPAEPAAEAQPASAPNPSAEVLVEGTPNGATEPAPEAPNPSAEVAAPERRKPARRSAEAERYRVQLPAFEGPLDLLLHLIQEHQLDILDIPIAFVTQKYLDFLDLMRELDLDIAGEYLLMSATLAHIKSKMLLPKDETLGDEDEQEEADPRGSLIKRLLEYQKYKQAAQELQSRPLLARDVFTRAPAPEAQPTEDAPLAEVSVFQLLEAFAEVLKRVGPRISHEVQIDRLSVSERITQLAERLRDVERIELVALLEGQLERHMIVVTFLALLEMTRLKMVRLFQEVSKGPILITSTGVQAAGLAADAAFEYKERPLQPSPVPPPRPLTSDEEAALRAFDDEDEARREEAAYAAFDDEDEEEEEEEDEDGR